METHVLSYLNDLMRNYPIDTDSVNSPEHHSPQSGGNTEVVDTPHGGFPPIYMCNERKELVTDTEKDSARGKATVQMKGVSIADIMDRRRKMKRQYIWQTAHVK